MTANNTANVSVGKGVAGGYFFLAPLGTALPTNNTTALGEAFVNIGYLGEDGVVFADGVTVNTFKDMNGDTIAVSTATDTKTAKATFSEIKADTLKVFYGQDNVADAAGTITVHDRGAAARAYVGVFELLLKDGRKWRRIAPQIMPGELGDLTINATTLVAREVTMTALLDSATGSYYVDYIDSTETSA